jgi:uroporphyrin-III C-methyltransferase/precorrin-2 dehydrogenase/sirohydrochlorin ferrochelatase
MKEGVSPSTPTVMMSNVSRGNEHWVGSLSELGEASGRRDASKPVIIGVGRVFDRAGHSKLRHNLEPAQRLQAEA